MPDTQATVDRPRPMTRRSMLVQAASHPPPEHPSPAPIPTVEFEVAHVLRNVVGAVSSFEVTYDPFDLSRWVDSQCEKTTSDRASMSVLQKLAMHLGSELVHSQYAKRKDKDVCRLTKTLTEYRQYKCTICDSFKTESINVLEDHLYYPHTSDSFLRTLICNICHFKTRSRQQFNDHSKNIHGITTRLIPPMHRFMCSLCTFECGSGNMFERHMSQCAIVASSTHHNNQAIATIDEFDHIDKTCYPSVHSLTYPEEARKEQARQNLGGAMNQLSKMFPLQNLDASGYGSRPAVQTSAVKNFQSNVERIQDVFPHSLHGQLNPFNHSLMYGSPPVISNNKNNKNNEIKGVNCARGFQGNRLDAKQYRHQQQRRAPTSYDQHRSSASGLQQQQQQQQQTVTLANIVSSNGSNSPRCNLPEVPVVINVNRLAEVFPDREVHAEMISVLEELARFTKHNEWRQQFMVSQVKSVSGICSSCPMSSFIVNLVEHHRKLHRLELRDFQRDNICIVCSRRFAHSLMLLQHQHTVHGLISIGSLGVFMQFSLPGEKHEQTHRTASGKPTNPIESNEPLTSDKKYYCKKCTMADLDFQSLCAHLNDRHGVDIRVLRSCEMCSVKVRRGQNMNDHLVRHLEPCTVSLSRLTIMPPGLADPVQPDQCKSEGVIDFSPHSAPVRISGADVNGDPGRSVAITCSVVPVTDNPLSAVNTPTTATVNPSPSAPAPGCCEDPPSADDVIVLSEDSDEDRLETQTASLQPTK